VPDEISWAGLAALAASGGLVPCESALVLLLGAIALGRVALGLLLLVAFSLGLAVVLMAIGALVLYAKKLLPEKRRTGNGLLFRWLPVASALIIIAVGFVTTVASLGWIQLKWIAS
jgi:ABC-type nickel/cobalt efflux system permease component RcnA